MTDTDGYDVKVGENLRRLRLARGMNQEQLAAAVAERGIPFRQQTIVKIEKGQRPLRLREADAITEALEVAIDALVGEEAVADWAAVLIHHTREVDEQWRKLADAARGLLRGKESLRHTLDTVKEKEIPVDEHLLNEAATVLQVDPVEVVRSAPKRLEAENAVEEAEYEAGVEYIRHDEEADRG